MGISLGDRASFSKTISESDVYSFAGLTGDFNGIHINRVEAENSIFKDRVAHGILVSGLISTVIGMYLPGPGTIYLGQELKFVAPVYINDTVTAYVEVVEIDDVKKRATLKTTVINQNKVNVIEGYAKVKLPK